MTTPYEIPLSPESQTFRVPLGSVTYRLTIVWNDISKGWVMDIADADDLPLAQGIPLVTGLDLLAQYKFLGIPGALVVQSDFDVDAAPTYEGLGTTSRLYFVTEP